MMLEQGIVGFLKTVPAITALASQRIYGVIRPQGADMPDVLIFRTGTVRQLTYCGTDKLVSANVQIDSYAMDGSCFDLAAAIRETLIDFSGNMLDVYVDQVTLSNEFPLTDPDPGAIRMTQLYNFWYRED